MDDEQISCYAYVGDAIWIEVPIGARQTETSICWECAAEMIVGPDAFNLAKKEDDGYWLAKNVAM